MRRITGLAAAILIIILFCVARSQQATPRWRIRAADCTSMIYAIGGEVQISPAVQVQNDSVVRTATAHQPNPEEVSSIEHILNAAYRLISGPSGSRDWDHFRSLFPPDARFIVSHRESSGKITSTTYTVDQFIQRAQGIFDKQGFYESPVANRIEVWDHMAHVWSTYESRYSPGEKPYTRGINSFQLLYDGKRWWVVTIYWQNEDASHPIPEKYLK